MLYWIFVLAIIAFVAWHLGLLGAAGIAFGLAKVLLWVFLALLVVRAVQHYVRGRV